ncbi:hypothetical protein [Candidatus Liberibacter sp.]|uniref:hypothetical protein n=1 Tax=Candidatus Liberibacter sp. TaxID=34022 RepID=UPI0015F3A4D2|nr:hypothetical protein [Candidatus Liberibacter sp.]MBA5724392.1 hypothetical protein [Candidatus Liberibacter sp.]
MNLSKYCSVFLSSIFVLLTSCQTSRGSHKTKTIGISKVHKISHHKAQEDLFKKIDSLGLKANDLLDTMTLKTDPNSLDFKNLESDMIKAFDATVQEISKDIAVQFRAYFQDNAKNIRQNLYDKAINWKVYYLQIHTVTQSNHMKSILEKLIARDPSDDNFKLIQEIAKNFVEQFPIESLERKRIEEKIYKSLGAQQVNSLVNQNPEFFRKWFQSTQIIKESGKEDPINIHSSIGDFVDSLNARGAITSQAVQYEYETKTSPCKGWQYISTEDKKNVLHKVMENAAQKSRKIRIVASKILKDTESLVSLGGIADFNVPELQLETLTLAFGKAKAKVIFDRVEILKYVSDKNAQFKNLSYDKETELLASLKPKSEPGDANALEWWRYNKIQQAFEKSYDDVKKNPLKYALENGFLVINPLPLDNPILLSEEIARRSQAQSALWKHKRVNMPLLSPEEAKNIQEILRKRTPNEIIDILKNINSHFDERSDVPNNLYRILDNKTLAYAGSLVQKGDYAMASKIIDGQQIRDRLHSEISPNQQIGKDLYIEFNAHFNKIMENLKLQTPEKQQDHFLSNLKEAILSYIASESKLESTDFVKNLSDSTLIDKAFQAVIGGSLIKK